MTTPQQTYPPAPQPPAPAAPVAKFRNTLGIVALAIAVIGFIFACIPGALIVGWVLLPIGFILGLVAVFAKNKAKWPAVAAIITSVVGTVIGFVVFFAVVVMSLGDAFGGSEVRISDDTSTAVVSEEEGETVVVEEEVEEAGAALGTRENPLALGTEFASDEWSVTINSATLGAEAEIVEASMLNEPADEGHEYLLVNYTVTYIGDDPDGAMPAFVGMDFVTSAGVTVDSLSKLVVAPDKIDTLSELYNGASATGNTVMQVPSPVDGVIAVRPGMIVDKVYVAIN